MCVCFPGLTVCKRFYINNDYVEDEGSLHKEFQRKKKKLNSFN